MFWATFWAIFFTDSSGHPASGQEVFFQILELSAAVTEEDKRIHCHCQRHASGGSTYRRNMRGEKHHSMMDKVKHFSTAKYSLGKKYFERGAKSTLAKMYI
jgi:hypothetical protein